jgi:hypothetical protein
VVWNEERRCIIGHPLCYVLESQGRASTTFWVVATTANARMEVGGDGYGFHCRIAQDSIWI